MIVAARVVDLESGARLPPGWGAPGAAAGASASAAPSGAPGHPGARGDVAGGLDLADQGRVDQAAAALGRPRPALTARAQQLGGRDPLARVRVQRAELAVGLEARERRVELDDELPRRLGGGRGRRHARAGLADQQPHVAAHRVEDDVVLAHLRTLRS